MRRNKGEEIQVSFPVPCIDKIRALASLEIDDNVESVNQQVFPERVECLPRGERGTSAAGSRTPGWEPCVIGIKRRRHFCQDTKIGLRDHVRARCASR